MKKVLLLSLLCFLSKVSLGQNYFIPHTLQGIPALPAPSWQTEWADVDHNGYKDMISSNEVTHELLVYKNTGGIVDSIPVSFPASVEKLWITDWNQDGWIDVVYSTNNHINFCLLLNNATGGFNSPVTLSGYTPAQYNENHVILRDLNNDTYPDLAFSIGSTTISFLLNSSGSSVVSEVLQPFPSHNGFDFTDVDGDNNMDIVIPLELTPYYAIIYQNTGAFNFSPVDTIPFSNGSNEIQQVYCLDLDNNGTDEIVAITDWQLYAAQQVTGFQFTQFHTSSFAYTVSSASFYGPSHRGITDWADVDGNGFKDLVIANSVYFVNNLTLTRATIISLPDFGFTNLKAVDSDNNGTVELWWNMHQYAEYGKSYMYSVNYAGGNSFTTRQRRWDINFFLYYVGNEKFIDLDQDGDRDFLYQSAGRIVVAANDGSDHFTDNTVADVYFDEIDIVDVDNDGLPDFLGINSNLATCWVTYYHNLGNLHFQNMGNIFTTTYPRFPHLISSADLNNDSLPDLVYIYTDNIMTASVEILKNNGGTFTSQGIKYTATGSNDILPVHADVADLDHNGFKDLVIDFRSGASGNYGKLAVLMNNGAFSFTTPINRPFANVDKRMGIADVNGDGFEDILLAKYESFFNYYNRRVFINNGNGTFAPEATLGAPITVNYYDFFTVDVDNDGVKDIVSASPSLSVSFNNGSGFGPFISNGTPDNVSDFPVQFDLDNDGDIDLFNGSQKTWFDNTAISQSKIHGSIFYDMNTNGIKDAGDVAVSNFPVGTSPLTAVTSSGNTGNFSLLLGGSTGTFAVQSMSSYNDSITFTTVPYPDTAHISTANPIDTVQIGFYSTGGIHQATLDQSMSQHRCSSHARLWLSAQNFSPLSSNFSLHLSLPSNVTYVSSSSVPFSQAGNQVTWNIPAFGFEQTNTWVDLMMPGSQYIGDTLTFISRLTSYQLGDTIHADDTLKFILTCSYDPNDKSLVPLNTILSGDHLYSFDDYVEYQVRFQNTGNDTAQAVIIKDRLPDEFDATTLQVISASHSYSYSMDGNGLLTFTFSNIALPDSGTSFTGSMGYIKFSARLAAGTTRKIPIDNTARIYFDQNPPVFTNLATFYRVECRDFVNSSFTPSVFCSGSDYTATLNDHGLNATYDWEINASPLGTGDTVQWHIPSTGIYTLGIHISLPTCEFDSIRTLNISLAEPNVVINAPPDTTVCPVTALNLSCNYPAQWFVNGIFSGAGFNYGGNSGDTIVASYTQSGCTGTAQTILHQLYSYHFPLLTDSVLSQLGTFNVCETATLTLTSRTPNTIWEYALDSYTATLFDTASSLSIFLDTLSTYGGVTLHFDTLGCTYQESYSIFIVHNTTTQIDIDTSDNLLCPGSAVSLFINSPVDSVELFISGMYDTTFVPQQFTGNLLWKAGDYTLHGYINGCEYPHVDFTIHLSTAPFPYIVSSGGLLMTSSGLDEWWWYSSDTSLFSFSLLGSYDTLFAPANGFYRLETSNSDLCPGTSPVYYFNQLGILFHPDTDLNVRYDELNNLLIADGLKSTDPSELTLFNMEGKLIWSVKASRVNRLPFLSTGIYTARIISADEVYIQKIRMITH